MKGKQKKLYEMRDHQVGSTPLEQPAVDQTLLATAAAQAEALGTTALRPVFVIPVGASGSVNLNHLFTPLQWRLRGSVMKQPKYSEHTNYWPSFERQFLVGCIQRYLTRTSRS